MDEFGNKLKGYWCVSDMVTLCEEFTDLFEFLYGERGCGVCHTMLLNMDWSRNHSAKPADACVLDNFNVHWRGRVDKPHVKIRVNICIYTCVMCVFVYRESTTMTALPC